MNNNDFVNNVTTELAIRLANTEIERAKFKAQAPELTTQHRELQKQLNDLKKQPAPANEATNDDEQGLPAK